MNYWKYTIVLCLAFLFGPFVANAHKADSVKLFQIVRLGVKYNIQEFQTLNQRTASACRCDEGLSLNNRSMQGLSVSMFEPINPNLALGADFGFSFGKRMNDLKEYSRQSAVTIAIEGFYHLFDGASKLRPYVTAGFRYDLQANHATAIPIGAGLRFKLKEGGSLFIQTAYDRGQSSLIAENMLTSLGFHLPLFIREQGTNGHSPATYAALLAKKSSLYPIGKNAKLIPAKPIRESILEKIPDIVLQDKKQLSRIIYFKKGRVNLDNTESINSLDDVMQFLVQDSNRIAKLVGFKPHPRYKVKVIYRYLIKQGIPTERLAVAYYRKRLQGLNSQTRRVEILVE
jgi:hypothetical protein